MSSRASTAGDRQLHAKRRSCPGRTAGSPATDASTLEVLREGACLAWAIVVPLSSRLGEAWAPGRRRGPPRSSSGRQFTQPVAGRITSLTQAKRRCLPLEAYFYRTSKLNNFNVASNLLCNDCACGGVQDGRKAHSDLREREVRGRRTDRGLHPVQGRGRPGRRPLPAFNIAPGHCGGVHRRCVCWRV